MKTRLILIYFILSAFKLFSQSQVESFLEYPFNGLSYKVFKVKIDNATLSKFDILENKNALPNQEFIRSLNDSLFFLINASISDSLCKPVGYFIKNSQQIQPVNLDSGNGNFYLKPNGALLFTNSDVIICESSLINGYQNVRLGIQSGPMLLKDGSINSNFNQNSKNKNIRCGVGLYSNNKNEKFIVFCISNNPVTFYELAILFENKFKCKNALCLESVGCSMYFPNTSTPTEIFNGLICNYLYFKI